MVVVNLCTRLPSAHNLAIHMSFLKIVIIHLYVLVFEL